MTKKVPLKRLLRQASLGTPPIKGSVAATPEDGLHPGYSASGQDVWLDAANAKFTGPGLVISAVGARCGKTFFATGRWGVVANTAVLIPRDGNDPKYLWYLLNDEAFWEKGTTAQPYVQMEASLAKEVVRPVPAEQHRIADFLDDQVARIDEIVRLREEQVEGIRVRLRSRVAAAVTGAQVPGRRVDTEIPWLGTVPADWDVLPIKRLGRSLIGLTYSPEDLVDSPDQGTLVLRSGNVQDGRIALDDNVYVKGAIPGRAVTRPGDILICARNGSAALVGKNAVISDDVAGAAFGAFMTVLRSPANEYLRWVLNSPIFTSQLGLFATTTINQLTREMLENLVVALPPVATQQQIADDLSLAENVATDAANVMRSQIDLLQERKRSLITAAVTGEFDVTAASGRGVA